MIQDTIPAASLLTQDAPHYGYRDSCVVDIGPASVSIDEVIPAFFASTPRWVDRLLALRNALVTPLGLKTGPMGAPDIAPPFQVGQSIGVFRIIALTGDEAVFGEDDRHLDFRVSLLLQRGERGNSLAVSTIVKINNGLGTGYFAVVKPFHRLIVTVMARNVARRLRSR
ncbi:DUF2867 domain-containing protein [Azospirillum canadense]|uniref:DUF2867 domain-containing protein n=1 Tax=Azospirillum canadense TaxID=403962 RepID=UPI0022260E69|nr:DUF2867 domain-containing protein [Azospirillum canadense]MCW2237361.1 hypothetical protein [Azospirillum canadense]